MVALRFWSETTSGTVGSVYSVFGTVASAQELLAFWRLHQGLLGLHRATQRERDRMVASGYVRDRARGTTSGATLCKHAMSAVEFWRIVTGMMRWGCKEGVCAKTSGKDHNIDYHHSQCIYVCMYIYIYNLRNSSENYPQTLLGVGVDLRTLVKQWPSPPKPQRPR